MSKYEKERNENIIAFEKTTIRDGFVFNEVMKNGEIGKRLLTLIIGDEIDSLFGSNNISSFIRIEKEKEVSPTPISHNIRTDSYYDINGKLHIIIELQINDLKNTEERAEYYSSTFLRSFLDPGEDYSHVPYRIFIMICDYDPFPPCGNALYKVKSIINDNIEDEVFKKNRYIFLNTHFINGNCSEELLDFLKYIKSDNINYNTTYTLTSLIKEEVKRIHLNALLEEKYMLSSLHYEEDIKRARREGIEKGRNEGILSTAKAMLNEGMSTSLISKITGLSISDIEKLK